MSGEARRPRSPNGAWLSCPLTEEQQALVARNLGLARLAVRRTYTTRQIAGIEAEDAYMMACEGLCRAAQLYAPSMGAESPYLYKAALRTIVRECDKQTKSCHACPGLLSLDEAKLTYRRSGDTVPLLDTLPATDSTDTAAIFHTAMEDALATMTKWERQCFILWCDGWKQCDIAKRRGCAPSNVNYALRQAKAKFKQQWERVE